MVAYSVFFKESVQRDFEGIPKKDSRKILSRIKSLANDPRPSGCEKLTGQDRYRLRQGRYRTVYFIEDEERSVTVVKVGHRKDIYRRSEQPHQPDLITSAGNAVRYANGQQEFMV